MKNPFTAFVLSALFAIASGCTAPPRESAEEPAAEEASAEEPSAEEPSAEEPATGKPAKKPATAEAPPRRHEEAPAPKKPTIVKVEVPEGTVLELELLTALDSEIQRSGDEIQARTVSPVYVEGELVLDAGTYVEGKVTEAQASGRVKGRARLAFTFDRMKTATGVVPIHTSYVEEEAESGKKKDAAIIGGAAGVGAIVGGILGGKKGAAIGASVGGAGGTGVVLSTKGEEIRLPVGSRVNVRLDRPVSVELR